MGNERPTAILKEPTNTRTICVCGIARPPRRVAASLFHTAAGRMGGPAAYYDSAKSVVGLVWCPRKHGCRVRVTGDSEPQSRLVALSYYPATRQSRARHPRQRTPRNLALSCRSHDLGIAFQGVRTEHRKDRPAHHAHARALVERGLSAHCPEAY